MSLAITETIKTIAEAERRFQLSRTEEESFFPEWWTDLPELSSQDRSATDELRRRYLYQRSEGELLEGTVILLLASPLLTLAGFYDPPFRVRGEESIRLILEDAEEVLQGRIDVLVLLDRFWVVVLESKKTALSVWTALPQTLAYLMANPYADRTGFAMVTNGDEIVFVKLARNNGKYYALSRVFAPFTSNRELDKAFQVLKRIGQVIREEVG
jgi:hypothetical protein